MKRLFGLILLAGTALYSQTLDFMQGRYDAVGRFPESAKTYSGKVTLEVVGDSMKVTRVIGGKTIVGWGKLETATADKIPVFRVRFTDQGKKWEITYQVHTDMNNYARLTGYVYPPGTFTETPGLEALFAEP